MYISVASEVYWRKASEQERTCRILRRKADLVEFSGIVPPQRAQFRICLTAEAANEVEARPIGECHANLECRLFEDALVDRYDFFVFEW